MPTYVEKRPKITAVQYKGDNLQQLVDELGVGVVGLDPSKTYGTVSLRLPGHYTGLHTVRLGEYVWIDTSGLSRVDTAEVFESEWEFKPGRVKKQ